MQGGLGSSFKWVYVLTSGLEKEKDQSRPIFTVAILCLLHRLAAWHVGSHRSKTQIILLAKAALEFGGEEVNETMEKGLESNR